MRLSTKQIETISRTVSNLLGAGSATYLFGSRLDDAARGGDVDILVVTEHRPSRLEKARVRMELEKRLELPVDIVFMVHGEEPTPFQAIAMAGATPLEIRP